MPVYEYTCPCGAKHSEVRSITDYSKNGPRKRCPKCLHNQLERVVNPGGFILEGDDWPSQELRQRRAR